MLLLFSGSFCFAERPVEVTYPEIPGVIKPVIVKTELAEYIKYVFAFILLIAGLITFGSLVWGGIIYLTSAGSPERMKEAKSRIFASILGLVIIFSSWLISNTINPQLVFLQPGLGLEVATGVALYNETGCQGEEKIITKNTPDFSETTGEKEYIDCICITGPGDCPEGKTSLGVEASKCPGCSKREAGGTCCCKVVEKGKKEFVARSLKFLCKPGKLDALVYPEINYKGNPLRIASEEVEKDCYNGFKGKSIKLVFQIPGVYLCDEPLENWICPGNEGYPVKTALLSPDFNDKVKGVRFKSARASISLGEVDRVPPGIAKEECKSYSESQLEKIHGEWICTYTSTRYGVVLHDHANYGGICSVLTLPVNDLNKELIKYKTSSVTPFSRPPTGAGEPGGVWLCEDPDQNRDDEGCYGPYQKGEFEDLPDGMPEAIPANKFSDGISSIIIEGSYIAVLFQHRDFKGECEVFDGNDSNFRDNPMGRCACIAGFWGCQDCLSSFIILPTK